MITDGGPHPPEKWAQVTTRQIVDDIERHAPQVPVGEAGEFRQQVERELTAHHDKVQQSERSAIVEHGDERLMHPLDPDNHLDAAVAMIVTLAASHSFAAYFARPQTQEYLRNVLASHFSTSMHIERAWHADRNPYSEPAKAFRAQHQGS